MATNKGFIKDWFGNYILPITRGELVLDSQGQVALRSSEFLADLNEDGLPGLMTAAEKRMLSGGGSGQGISDLYTKIEYINNGIQVNGSTLKFYTTASNESTHTPINITSPEAGQLSITATSTNVINIALKALKNEVTSLNGRLDSIIVDEYGRVTSVTSSPLVDSEIPKELTEKTLVDVTFTNAKTSDKEIGTDELAVVNKAYVDAQIREITGLATGALKFGGTLSDADAAIAALNNPTGAYEDHYFKVTGNFTVEAKYLHATTEKGENQPVKLGDTLIIHESKFVYVPSADEAVTSLTVYGDGETDKAIDDLVGPLTLKFSSLFQVKNNPVGSKTAYIHIPAANGETNGYLTAADWIRFNNYESGLAVTYTGAITATTAGSYTIGTIKIGTGNPQTIYGINNISTLTLENGATTGSNVEYNPILKFTETGVVNPYEITLEGTRGIQIKKNGQKVQFVVVNTVATNSTKYLEVDPVTGDIGVKIGSLVIEDNITKVQDGLTDFNDFATFRANVIATTTSFELIHNSLSDTSKTYYYGSTSLTEAVDFESSETI